MDTKCGWSQQWPCDVRAEMGLVSVMDIDMVDQEVIEKDALFILSGDQ